MREDLALKHLLLNENREIEKQANNLKENSKEIIQAIKQISQTLTIEYNQAQLTYSIKAVVKEKEVIVNVAKKEFEFYQKADSEKSPVRQKGYSIGQDPVATNNQQKARELLSNLLSQTGLFLPKDLFTPNLNSINQAHKIDWFAWIVVCLIGIASSILTYYQGTRTFNLIDNTYTLEAAWRILNGEVPYRDFNLIVMPGIYLKQALLMKLFGNYAIVGVWWCVAAMFITVLLTYKILKLIDTPRGLSVSLCLIAGLGGNIIRPYVWYDVDALIFCLASIALFLWSEKKTSFTKQIFTLGFLTAIPLIFKQNIGLAHLVVVSGIVYFQWLAYPNRFSWKRFFQYHFGVTLALSLLIIPFWYLGALSQLFYNTFFLASKLRIQKPIFQLFLETYPMLREDYYLFPHYFPLPVYSCSFLTWGALAFGMISWFVGTHRSMLQMLLPFWVLGLTLAGVYALGAASIFPLLPLMAIMIALVWNFIEKLSLVPTISYYAIHIIVILLSGVILSHALAGYQLFFYANAFINPTPFKIDKLRGMSASPEAVAALEEITGIVNQIPQNESIALFVTEDPIYFLTNRRSPLKTLQRYKSSGGDPETIYLPELKKVQPLWVLLKIKPQFAYGQNFTASEIDWLNSNYQEVKKSKYYVIWKRIDKAQN